MAISNIIDVSDSSVESASTLVLGSSSYFDLSGGDVSAGPVASSTITAVPSSGPVAESSLSIIPKSSFGPFFDHVLEVRLAGIKGKQIATGAAGVATANLVDNVLAANAAGRSKIQDGFFDAATVAAKFDASSIALDRLAEAVLRADGGTQWTGNQNAGGWKLTGLGTPTADTDAATKAYVDAAVSGLDLKASVRLATAAALPANTPAGSGVGKTLTGNANGALTVDGVAVAVNDRILVKDEVSAQHNGIYVVTTVGDGSNPFVLTRATDADSDAEVTTGMFCFVSEGTVNADSGWVLVTDDPITLDTTALSFTQFSGAGQITAGAGLTKTGNTLDVGAGNGIQVNADSIEVLYGLAAAITTINAGDVASAGVANAAARADHEHAVSTAAPTVTVKSDAAVAAEGTATSLLRSDAQIVAQTAVPSVTIKSEATAASQGTSQSLLRADAQLQAATAAPLGGTIQSDAGSPAQGSASTLLRSDATFTAITAVPVAVGTTNAQGTSTSLARADHVHAAPAPTTADKDVAPAATSGDESSTDIAITNTPALGSMVQVVVNGIVYTLGDGVKTKDCYFSADGGTTARAISAITASDVLYWNGVIAGFDLTPSDRVSLFYEAF